MTKHTHFLHPGQIIKIEFLDAYGLSVKAAAEAMNMPRTRLNDIVRGVRGISADTAVRLSRFFGPTAQSWMNMQSHYDLALVEAGLTLDQAIQTIRPVKQSHAETSVQETWPSDRGGHVKSLPRKGMKKKTG